MNEEWADFLAEIEHRRTASYEVATDLSDEGKDAERAFGKVDAYDEVIRLVSSVGAVFPADDDDAIFDERPTGAAFEALYAPGRRVRFDHPDGGYPADQKMAASLLTPGEVYTIAWSDIGFASTSLTLAGIEDRGQGFNSVLFEPVDDEARESTTTAAQEKES